MLSLHFIFRDEDHLKKVLANQAIVGEFRKMVAESVQGAHVMALMTMGLRNMYSKKEIKSVDDVKGLKVRVQRPRPRTRTSRPTAPRPSICRSARCTRRSRPAS